MSNLVLSSKEVRDLERKADSKARKRLREKNRLVPTRFGWPGKNGGSTVAIEPSYEVIGTSVQVCGFWPFAAGSSTPVVGVPLGVHLLRGTPVCGDPVLGFMNNLIMNPSLFVLGRPGLGKSSVVRRMEAVWEAWGILPMVLGDLKPDHVDLIQEQGGQIISVGPGRSAVNPLDRGPLWGMLSKLPEDVEKVARADLRAFQVTTVRSLIAHAMGRPLQPVEDSIVAKGLRLLDEYITDRQPVLPDMLRLIEEHHPDISKLVQDRGNEDTYIERTRGLTDVLRKLGPEGPYGDIFSRPTTVEIKLDRPVAFDLSSIDDSDMALQAAVQQVCWAYGSSAVSAARRLASAGIVPERHYVLIMDEMWRMLRADPKLVHFIDALTRLNRTMGVGQVMITHTMNDLDLPHEEETKMAWGFVERSGMVLLGGLAEAEMGNLSTVFALSEAERTMITDWSSEITIDPETGKASAPPGLGCFLMKVGKKPGIPFRMVMTDVERHVNDTNKSWQGMAEAMQQQREKTASEALNEELGITEE